jgi:hypothetical protein
MIEFGDPVSYATVMLDWAITECNSERWRGEYAKIPHIISPATLAAASTSDDLDTSLTEQQKAELVAGVEYVRSPILLNCRVSASWRFRRCRAELIDLRKFRVMPWWFAGPTVGDEEVRWRRGEGLGSLIPQVISSDKPLRGTPIAIATGNPSEPMLIEGYLRSAVALRTGAATFTFYLGEAG